MKIRRLVLIGAVAVAMVVVSVRPASASLDPTWNDRIAPWLLDVEVVAPDDVWAVGMQERPAGKRWPLIVHRDAMGWTEVPFPRDGWTADAWLVAVDASGPDDVWAVGNYLPDWDDWSWWDPLVLHWDGFAWSRVETPDFRHFVEIRDVEAIDQDRAFIAGRLYGDPLLLRWDGAAWERHGFPRGDMLYGIDATSRSDIWAVGLRSYDGQAYRFVAPRWRMLRMPQLPEYGWQTGPSYLHDVEIRRPDRVWFVGSQWLGKSAPEDGLNERSVLLAQRWDGRRIRVVPTPAIPGPFEEAMGLASADGVTWVAGYRTRCCWGRMRALVLIRTAHGWWRPTVLTDVRPSALMAVDGVGRRDVWAVGLGGDEPLILRGNGGSWVRETVATAVGR